MTRCKYIGSKYEIQKNRFDDRPPSSCHHLYLKITRPVQTARIKTRADKLAMKLDIGGVKTKKEEENRKKKEETLKEEERKEREKRVNIEELGKR